MIVHNELLRITANLSNLFHLPHKFSTNTMVKNLYFREMAVHLVARDLIFPECVSRGNLLPVTNARTRPRSVKSDGSRDLTRDRIYAAGVTIRGVNRRQWQIAPKDATIALSCLWIISDTSTRIYQEAYYTSLLVHRDIHVSTKKLY